VGESAILTLYPASSRTAAIYAKPRGGALYHQLYIFQDYVCLVEEQAKLSYAHNFKINRKGILNYLTVKEL
jgi:hypothetical protein